MKATSNYTFYVLFFLVPIVFSSRNETESVKLKSDHHYSNLWFFQRILGIIGFFLNILGMFTKDIGKLITRLRGNVDSKSWFHRIWCFLWTLISPVSYLQWKKNYGKKHKYNAMVGINTSIYWLIPLKRGIKILKNFPSSNSVSCIKGVRTGDQNHLQH